MGIISDLMGNNSNQGSNQASSSEQASEDQGQANNEAPEKKKYLYVCTKNCTYRGKFFREGEYIYLNTQGEKVPHFKEKTK